MGSNQEITRIQEWVANWYGTTVEKSPFTREDIRNICRGPMREVLVDFIVSRFRTDAHIKVIRSNLFLTDVINNRREDHEEKDGFGNGANPDEEQIKQLKGKLEEIRDEKTEIVKQILKTATQLRESETHVEKKLLENLTHFEKLESRMQLISHRVLSTTALLEDVCNIKLPNPAILETTHSSSDISRSEPISPQLTQLRALYNKASDLFNMYFLHTPPLSNYNASNASSSEEMLALTSAVSNQTVELTQSGLKPKFVEKWARKEQDASINQVNKVESQFSNVMSPVEQLANEAEALHLKLMRAHVNLFFKNKDLHRSIREIKIQKTRKIQNVVLNDANVVPADLLSFVQKEEQQKKLMKCRELAKEFTCANEQDSDMLAMLCGQLKSDEKLDQTPGTYKEECKNSIGSLDASFSTVKQETLEDLTCTLLKCFPEGRNKLESTVSQCKNLVMRKFANLFEESSVSNSSKLSNMHSERGDKTYTDLDLQVKMPQLMLKQEIFSNFAQPVRTTNEQSQMDFLKEVFMVQNELKESRLQYEALFEEK